MATLSKTAVKKLEQKFAETAFRITQERNDFLLPQVLDFIRRDKWINLKPEYQRRLVWDVKKRSLFIESLLLNIPIPPLFLYEWDLNRYEVMDGQQRLNAVLSFYEDSFALKGLERWEELNDHKFSDLPETLRRGLDRRRLSATVLVVDSSTPSPQRSDVRKLVFERLNTGGQHLNAQELRNCLYAGHFNDLLIKLGHDTLFARLWDIPPYDENVHRDGTVTTKLADDRLYKRMLDCEIVLRYFAFRERSRIRGSVRSILDKTMEDYQFISKEDAAELGDRFLKRLRLAHEIFGSHTFRYQDEKRKWKLSQPLYDAVMVALDRFTNNRTRLRAKRAAVVKAISRLLRNERAYAVVVGRPNTAKAIHQRIDLISRAISRAIRS